MTEKKNIRKAVFPLAGLGLRFLPATKANPKEMLTVLDKPLIQYAVEEAVRAGLTHMIFVTSQSKRAIEDHFDTNFELESRLERQGKYDLLTLVKDISLPNIQFTYVRQSQPLGLGHAILSAEHVVGDEPFAVLLADDLIDDSIHPCLSTMLEGFKTHGQSMIAIQPICWQDVHQYGVVSLQDASQRIPKISSIIEKPSLDKAPSNLVAIGRYVFNPSIFTYLRQTSPDLHGELQLTDGIKKMMFNESIYAWQSHAKRFDCGSKLGYLKAIIETGMLHKTVGKNFVTYLKSIINEYDMENYDQIVYPHTT